MPACDEAFLGFQTAGVLSMARRLIALTTVLLALGSASASGQQPPRADLRARQGTISQICFHPSGKFLASSHANDERIRIWDIAERRAVATLGVRLAVIEGATREKTAEVEGMAFSPDGTRLYEAYSDLRGPGGIQHWTIKPDGQPDGRHETLLERAEGLRAFALSPDGSRYAVNMPDAELSGQKISIRESIKGEVQFELREPRLAVSYLEFVPESPRLVSGGGITTTVWDLDSKKPLRTFGGHKNALTALCVSPDGKLLATGGADDKIFVWNLEDGAKKHEIKSDTGGTTALAFSRSGRSLVSAGGDMSLRVWSVGTGKLRETLRRHTRKPLTLAFSPDGKTLASAGQDEIVFLWDFTEPAEEEKPSEEDGLQNKKP